MKKRWFFIITLFAFVISITFSITSFAEDANKETLWKVENTVEENQHLLEILKTGVTHYTDEEQSRAFNPSLLVWNNDRISLPIDAWRNVGFLDLTVFLDNGEGYLDLGADNIYELEGNDLLYSFDGTWLSIDGQPIAYYYLYVWEEGDKYLIRGYSPVLLNGEKTNLILDFTDEKPYGYLAGTIHDIPKEVPFDLTDLTYVPVQKGDHIQCLCNYIDYGGEIATDYWLGKEIVLGDTVTISNSAIEDESHTIALYRFIDKAGNKYWTPGLDIAENETVQQQTDAENQNNQSEVLTTDIGTTDDVEAKPQEQNEDNEIITEEIYKIVDEIIPENGVQEASVSYNKDKDPVLSLFPGIEWGLSKEKLINEYGTDKLIDISSGDSISLMSTADIFDEGVIIMFGFDGDKLNSISAIISEEKSNRYVDSLTEAYGAPIRTTSLLAHAGISGELVEKEDGDVDAWKTGDTLIIVSLQGAGTVSYYPVPINEINRSEDMVNAEESETEDSIKDLTHPNCLYVECICTKPEGIGEEDYTNRVAGTIRIIEDRLNNSGFHDFSVQYIGSDVISVKIWDALDDSILDLICAPARLEFKAPSGETFMTGDMVKTSTYFYADGDHQIAFTLTDEGAKILSEMTAANIGREIAIYLDGEMLISPTVQTAITNGFGIINGMQTAERATTIAAKIQSGALPLELTIKKSELITDTIHAAEKEALEKAKQEDDKKVILKMGDTVITKGEVKEQIDSVLQYNEYMYSMMGQSYDVTDPQVIASAQEEAIDDLKKDLTLTAKAKELGLDQLTAEEEETVKTKAQEDYDSAVEYVKTNELAGAGLEGEELDKAVSDYLVAREVTLDAYIESERKTVIDNKVREYVVKDIPEDDEDAKYEVYNSVVEKWVQEAGIEIDFGALND